jgi:cell division protein FtsI/penicillin-binding protein 2
VDENENKKFEYYGGVQCTDVGESPWSLDYNNAFSYDNYLTYSNNLYHSVMIMFGMQRSGRLMDILKAPGNDAYAFPVITLDGTRYSFDKEKWYKGGNMEVGMGIMSSGLKDNFNIYEEMVDKTNLYSNYFGEEAYLSILFKQKSDWRGWVYTETGSQNNPDRNLPPFIRNGLIQMSLGSYPLEVSPLQMATMAMRLASLNRSPNITTLSDSVRQIPSYEFFRTPTWRDSTAYFNFYKRQVLVQLRKVPKVGTARSLNHLVEKYEAQGYYIYAKTGTLNLPDKGNERLKSLLVIISNTPLENVSSITDLQKVKYYVLYLSYIGIDKYEFGSTNRFGKVISATIESELFKKYMNSK